MIRSVVFLQEFDGMTLADDDDDDDDDDDVDDIEFITPCCRLDVFCLQ